MNNLDKLSVEYLVKLAEKSVKLPNGIGHPVLAAHGDSWSPYYKFIYSIVKEFRPSVAVECGVCQAIGSCHMAHADPDLIVVGVDRGYHENAWVHAPLFPNIHLVTGDTMLSVGEVVKFFNGNRIGLLFLDSTHLPWVPKAEFNTYAPYFDDVCIVVMDDVAIPAMEEFWPWVPGEKGRVDFLHPSVNIEVQDTPGFGFTIIRR